MLKGNHKNVLVQMLKSLRIRSPAMNATANQTNSKQQVDVDRNSKCIQNNAY